MGDFRDLDTARKFLDFMMDYYALVRRHFIENNEYRLHSHSFSALNALKMHHGTPVTMTDLAGELAVTKQQLTKLVNDLEDKGYVSRSHNKENRRQVYVEITDAGMLHIDEMLDAIVNEILLSLYDFPEDDKAKIAECATTLTEIFRRDERFCRLREDLADNK